MYWGSFTCVYETGLLDNTNSKLLAFSDVIYDNCFLFVIQIVITVHYGSTLYNALFWKQIIFLCLAANESSLWLNSGWIIMWRILFNDIYLWLFSPERSPKRNLTCSGFSAFFSRYTPCLDLLPLDCSIAPKTAMAVEQFHTAIWHSVIGVDWMLQKWVETSEVCPW